MTRGVLSLGSGLLSIACVVPMYEIRSDVTWQRLTQTYASVTQLTASNGRALCTTFAVAAPPAPVRYVSAAHCLQAAAHAGQSLVIDGTRAEILLADHEHDVLILQVPHPRPPLVLAAEDPVPGMPFAAVGYPGLWKMQTLMPVFGRISVPLLRFDNQVWSEGQLGDAVTAPGMSGSPVLNPNLAVIGVVLGVATHRGHPSTMGIHVSLARLKAALRSLPVQVSRSGDPGLVAPESLQTPAFGVRAGGPQSVRASE